MINKDVVYIVSFILIIINSIIYNITNIPTYTNTIMFKLIFLICTTIILHYNIYIVFFLCITYLNVISN